MQDAPIKPLDPTAPAANASNLTRNFGILLVGEVVSKVIGFFVFGRLGRVLGDSCYGELEFAFATTTIAALLADAGLVVFGARAVARDPSTARSLMPSFFVLRGALVVLSLIAIGLIAASGRGASPAILLACGLVLLPVPFVCDWFFQGRDEMVVVTISNVVRQSCLLVGVLLFVDAPSHAWRVPIADAVGLAVVAGLHQVLLGRRCGRWAWKGALNRAQAVVREAAPLGLSTVAWAVRFWAPMVFVGMTTTGGFKGQYGAAHRLAVAMHQVVFLYFYNLLPTWSRLATTGDSRIPDALRSAVRRSTWISLAGAILMITTTWLLAPDVIRLLGYGAEFEKSADILRWLCVVPAVAWISGNARFGLIAAGNSRGDMWANAAGAACVVGAYFAWIHSAETVVVPAFIAAEVVTGLVALGLWSMRSNSKLAIRV